MKVLHYVGYEKDTGYRFIDLDSVIGIDIDIDDTNVITVVFHLINGTITWVVDRQDCNDMRWLEIYCDDLGINKAYIERR